MRKPKATYEVLIYGHAFVIAATSVGNAVRRCFRSLCPKNKRKSYLGQPEFNDPAPLISNRDGGWEGVQVKLAT